VPPVGIPRTTGKPALDVDTAARRAVDFLLCAQHEDGSWRDARYAYWPNPEILPNVFMAITALAARALHEWRELDPARIDVALRRAETYLKNDENVALDRHEEVYAQAYRLHWFARRKDEAAIARVVRRLCDLQDVEGFWSHEYQNPFSTGVVVHALHVAREAGAEVPEFEDPRWAYVIGPPMRFAAGWRREVENYLDMSHFAFAHRTTLGMAADPRIPEMEITLHGDGFQMDAPFPALAAVNEPPGKLQSAHHRQQRCWLPNFTTIRQSFPDGDERVLVHVPSPNTPESCTVFWSLAISPGFRGPPPAQQIEFAVRVLDEDRQMCELQLPREVPLNPARGGWGVLVMPGDTVATTFQKQLRRWLLAGGPRRSTAPSS
jgi:hypothetical protein